MLHKIENIVHEAGEIILNASDTYVYEKNGHCNYVTDTDFAIQAFLRERLLSIAPESLFFAEEQENGLLTNEPTWVVDPLDGTLNFMHHRRNSCVSVALLQNKSPVLGAVYNPYTNEMFLAEYGNGSFLNGLPLHVSATCMEHAIVSFGTSPYNTELANITMFTARLFMAKAADLRCTGSAAINLADISCGRSDIFFEFHLSPWDFAAGALLVMEAGGYFIMPNETATQYAHPAAILACNVSCAAEALAIVHNAAAHSDRIYEAAL